MSVTLLDAPNIFLIDSNFVNPRYNTPIINIAIKMSTINGIYDPGSGVLVEESEFNRFITSALSLSLDNSLFKNALSAVSAPS
jgi:hypothetical protein